MEKFRFKQVLYSIDELDFISLLFIDVNNEKNLFFDGSSFYFTSEIFLNMKELENFNSNHDTLEITKIVKEWLDINTLILFSNDSIIYIRSGPFGYGDDFEIVLFTYEKSDISRGDYNRENYNWMYNSLLKKIELSKGYEINDD